MDAHVDFQRDLDPSERFPTKSLREQAQSRAVDELALPHSLEGQDRG